MDFPRQYFYDSISLYSSNKIPLGQEKVTYHVELPPTFSVKQQNLGWILRINKNGIEMQK